MKDGLCPKCGSHEIYSGQHLFPKSGPFGSNSIPVSLTSLAALDNYVCVDCGYLESYVESSKLAEIAHKWYPVGPSAAEYDPPESSDTPPEADSPPQE